jgi:hypothetical protein
VARLAKQRQVRGGVVGVIVIPVMELQPHARSAAFGAAMADHGDHPHLELLPSPTT